MPRHLRRGIRYFVSSFAIVLGVILVWRGIWYALEWVDRALFGGEHWISVVGGVVLGFLILYLPDGDLSELRKL